MNELRELNQYLDRFVVLVPKAVALLQKLDRTDGYILQSTDRKRDLFSHFQSIIMIFLRLRAHLKTK